MMTAMLVVLAVSAQLTGSWEAYPLRGEGFGSGVAPKVKVAPPAAISEPPLRQPFLDQWRAVQAQNAELTRKGLPPPSTGMACMPEGMPGMMQATFPMEILETPGQVTVIEEAFNQVRRPSASRTRCIFAARRIRRRCASPSACA
jgi:hypothetical protein